MILIKIIFIVATFIAGFIEGCNFRKAKEENDKTEGDLGSDFLGNKI